MSAELNAELVWAEALADPAFREALAQGMSDVEAGRVYHFGDMRDGYCGARLVGGTYCHEPSTHVHVFEVEP